MASPLERVRPRRVALGVAGSLVVAGVLGVAVAAGPQAWSAFQGSRPAPEPALPDAPPLAVSAQEEMESRGGARWSGVWLVDGQEKELSEGQVDFTDGECSFSVSQGRPGERETWSGSRHTSGRSVVSSGTGPWLETVPLSGLSTPVPLVSFAPRGICTLVEDVSRNAGAFTPEGVPAGLPAPTDDRERQGGKVLPENVQALTDQAFFESFVREEGEAPSRTAMEESVPRTATLTDRDLFVALDVDQDGLPRTVWLVVEDTDTSLLRLDFQEFGPQQVTLPAEFEELPDR